MHRLVVSSALQHGLMETDSRPGRRRAANAAGHSWKHGTQDSGERAASGRGAHRLASSLRIGEGGKGDAGDFWTSVREGSLT